MELLDGVDLKGLRASFGLAWNKGLPAEDGPQDRPGPKRKKKLPSKGELMPDSKKKRKKSPVQRGINARFQQKKNSRPKGN